MKILVVGDFTAQPCGIRNFADQTFRALSNDSRLEVHTWDGHYPELYRRREAGEPCYLPRDAESYDVIHVNWHPIAFNTYGPGHFPLARRVHEFLDGSDGETFRQTGAHRRPILSVYLHDIPPWSGCPFHDRADVRFAAEPSPGCVELPYPVADWIELPPPDLGFSVGCSTLRGDGVWKVKEICDARGWDLRLPDRSKGWLTFEEEVQRIARNTVNVLWYFEGRGKSGGLSQAVSAKRPVICSDSSMFSHFHDCEEIWFPFEAAPTLEKMLDALHFAWENGTLDTYRPINAAETHSWSRAVDRMVAVWQGARTQ